MGLWKDFKEFIARGNAIDLAIGVVIGAAFSGIVNSLVNDIIMPPIGLLLARVNFADLFINLTGEPVESVEAAKAAGIPTINYGLFINALINFLIITLVIFLVIRLYKRLTAAERAKPEDEPVNKDCPYCKRSIPIEAIRCPECTSQLTQGTAAD